MEKMIGFIGMGNMGQAIVKGILEAGFTTAENVIASRRNVDLLQEFLEEQEIECLAIDQEDRIE